LSASLSKVPASGSGVSIDGFGVGSDAIFSFTCSWGSNWQQRHHPQASDGEHNYMAGEPMGRFGEGGEIAAAIAFLLSDDAAFITRQTLFADGGPSIRRVAL